MDEREFKERTKQLALRIIRLVGALPEKRTAAVIGGQLLRAGTSVGANYRSACRGRSKADVLSRLAIVEEEADETLYWLELLVESGLMPKRRLKPLMTETDEIVAMTVASIKTLRSRRSSTKNREPQIQDSTSQRTNPKSKIQNPESRNANPKSKTQNPKS